MIENDYKNIFVLKGGWKAWMAAELPVEAKE